MEGRGRRIRGRGKRGREGKRGSWEGNSALVVWG